MKTWFEYEMERTGKTREEISAEMKRRRGLVAPYVKGVSKPRGLAAMPKEKANKIRKMGVNARLKKSIERDNNVR